MPSLRFKTAQWGTISSEGESSRPSADALIVVLHGMGNGSEKIKPAADVLKKRYPNSDVWGPLLPYRSFLAVIPAEKILEWLDNDLTELWKKHHYTSVIFVGHSIGGLFARALILRGRKSIGTDQVGAKHWAASID